MRLDALKRLQQQYRDKDLEIKQRMEELDLEKQDYQAKRHEYLQYK